MGLVILLLSAATAAARPDPAQTAMLDLRHFALSACLAQAFPAISGEALAAQGAYLELGSHPAETYQAVEAMAGRWLQRTYPSFRDVTLDVMKCIDFSESKELASWAAARCPGPGNPG